jgi:hypothetical protein
MDTFYPAKLCLRRHLSINFFPGGPLSLHYLILSLRNAFSKSDLGVKIFPYFSRINNKKNHLKMFFLFPSESKLPRRQIFSAAQGGDGPAQLVPGEIEEAFFVENVSGHGGRPAGVRQHPPGNFRRSAARNHPQ